jgi:hypothetical protein
MAISCRNASSVRLRRVMSLAILEAPTIDPFASLLASPDFLQYDRLFIDVGRWNQYRDRFADNLLRGITEYAPGGLVPGRDYTVERLADDRIIRGLHDCGKAALDLVRVRAGITQRLLRPFAIGDVLDRADESPGFSARVTQ